MTKAEYAARGILQDDGKYKKVSKAYLSKGQMKTRLEPAMRADSDGVLKIDADLADEILRNARDPSRSMSHMSGSGKPASDRPASNVGTFEAVRTDREKTKLENEKLDLAHRKGDTLAKPDVTKAVSAAGQILRDQLKSNSRRLAEKFSTMTDVREIRAVIDEENSKLLKQMSNDFLRRLPTLEDTGGSVTTH